MTISTDTPKVTAIVPWFGSKRTLAARIVQQLGPHRCYWEPFAGSMAVLLDKPRATMETVNDLHGDLIHLARTIKDPVTGPQFYRQCRRTLFAKDLFTESVSALKVPFAPTLDRAYWFFVNSWFGRNGTVGSNGGNNFSVRYTSKGGQPGTRWVSTVRSIPSWRRRLEGVIILNDCGLAICERIEDLPGTVIYCDPPYLVKGAKYIHDFLAADHLRLAAALCRFKKTRVVVSYYDHPQLASLYPGWTRVPLSISKAMVNMGRRNQSGPVEAPELLLINGPAHEGELFQ